MFNELVESCVAKSATKKTYGIALSAFVQSVALVVLLVIPLIYTQALPGKVLGRFLVVPPPVLPAPIAATAARAVAAKPRAYRQISDPITQPTNIPTGIKVPTEPEAPLALALSDGADGVATGLDLFAADFGGPAASIPPPPPPVVTKRVKQGGDVVAARIIAQPRPEYPLLARMAHIQGDVVLHAIIDRSGSISELQVISGPPLLVKAALDEVRAWRYRPTLLGGEPVEVDTTITMSFVLAQ